MRKATIAYKFEDLGWSVDTYITTICNEKKFCERWMKYSQGNGIVDVKVLEFVKVTTLDEIDDTVNGTIITEEI